MNHRDEVYCQLLESSIQTAALLEPADALLDDTTTPVELAIEALPSVVGMLVFAPRDHGLDRMPAQPIPDRGEAVALVAREGFGSGAPTNPHPIHDFFELRALVDLSRRDVDGEGKAVAVSDQVELAPESAARAAQRVVDGFVGAPFFPAPAAERDARTIVPSTHQRSQSIWPSASRRTCSASRIRAYTPRRRQELKW